MNKLEDLDISNTDIGSGLEYLPKSVKKFFCSADEKPDAKCRTIYDLFTTGGQGKIEESEV